MNEHIEPESSVADGDSSGSHYEPPRITPLGTLADLTAGGGVTAPDDGMGGAGDEGSF